MKGIKLIFTFLDLGLIMLKAYNTDTSHIQVRFEGIYRRWAGKTSCVHLAPEYEYSYKHLMKAFKNQFKTYSMALNTFKGFC